MPSPLSDPLAVIRIIRSLVAGSATTATASPSSPAGRAERALASAAHRGFQISVLISFALLFGLMALNTHRAWFESLKLALGATMMGEGFLLAFDWHGARRLTLQRLRQHRPIRDQTRSPMLMRLAWKIASPTLQSLGLIWLTTGLLMVLLGFQDLA